MTLRFFLQGRSSSLPRAFASAYPRISVWRRTKFQRTRSGRRNAERLFVIYLVARTWAARRLKQSENSSSVPVTEALHARRHKLRGTRSASDGSRAHLDSTLPARSCRHGRLYDVPRFTERVEERAPTYGLLHTTTEDLPRFTIELNMEAPPRLISTAFCHEVLWNLEPDKQRTDERPRPSWLVELCRGAKKPRLSSREDPKRHQMSL